MVSSPVPVTAHIGVEAPGGGFLGPDRHSSCLLGAQCLDRQGRHRQSASKYSRMIASSLKGSVEEGAENFGKGR